MDNHYVLYNYINALVVEKVEVTRHYYKYTTCAVSSCRLNYIHMDTTLYAVGDTIVLKDEDYGKLRFRNPNK